MTTNMKKLYLYLTTVSEHKNRLSKLVYDDDNVLIFNDKTTKYNYVFTLDSGLALYYALNYKSCKSILFVNEVYEELTPPKQIETFSIFDKKPQTSTIKTSKNQITLYGFRIGRIRNLKPQSKIKEMVIEPFEMYKSHFKKKKHFVSMYSLIDGLIEINEKFFKSDGGHGIRTQLELLEDVFDEDRVLTIGDDKRWKMSKEGQEFCISPVFGVEEIKPEKPNEWLKKVLRKI